MEKFIERVIGEAGDVILADFGKIGVKYTKEHEQDVVTEADLKSNDIIVGAIKKEYSNHGIISEETGEYQTKSEYVWIVDPLDGTYNFSQGIPLFGIIIGLAKNGEVIMGAIYLPYFKEFYFAKKGEGAFLNGNKIQCSNPVSLAKTYGISSSNLKTESIILLEKILNSAKKERFLLAALGPMAVHCAYVASGKYDWLISKSGNIWDFAGAIPILTEAGCLVADGSGQPWKMGGDRGIVTGNKDLMPKLLEIIG